METYNGLVRTPTDAIILFEACRLGLLPRVQRRLSEKERQSIRSGSVFVWDEREAGMRRWTDGKSWSASRVSGSFLTYREMEGKRGSTSFVQSGSRATKTPDSGNGEEPADGEEGPDGYRYKPDGLMKQSFSITTTQGQHLHLISYYSRSSPTSNILRQPSQDPNLASIQPAKGMYPESTVADQTTVPAVTRSPMPGAPNYVPSPTYSRAPHPPPHAYIPAGYIPHPAYMGYPMSPMHTPPPYGMHPAYAGMPMHYPYGQPGLPMNHAPPAMYDQRPLRDPNRMPDVTGMRQNGTPPSQLPPSQHGPPNTQAYHHNSYPSSQPHEANGNTTSASVPFDSRLDPRLGASSHPPASPSQLSPRDRYEDQQLPQPSIATGEPIRAMHAPLPVMSSAPQSQAPTINSLVTSNLPTTSNSDDARPASQHDPDMRGNTSPGDGAHTQDIPSEKLGFSADKRALSMLDRGFARV